jgi:hypothetical protein
MNSPTRAALALAVLGCVGAIGILSRSEPRPVGTAPASGVLAATPKPAAPEPGPAPTPRAALVTPPAMVASALADTPTEDSLAATMHTLEDSKPERALELARQGQALWPAGPRAAEFAATEVKCLYRLGKPSEGRGAAETMVNKYPSSPWAVEVEKQTGAHPHINH